MILIPSPAPEIANRLIVVVDYYFPSNVIIGLRRSRGIVGTFLASGGIVGPATYAVLNGTIIINNTISASISST